MNLTDKINNTCFTWGKACYQHRWGFHVWPTEDQIKNIEKVASVLQKIKDYYPKNEMFITSWLRCKQYNDFIKGAPASKHSLGMAVDFYIAGVSCEDIRKLLEPKLEELNIRMERGPRSWVHIDIAPVMTSRYFHP